MPEQPFVLRMAGFPFGWLTELADGATAAAADEIVARERDAGERGAAQDVRLRTERFHHRYDDAIGRARLAVCAHFVRDDAVRDALFALNPDACALIEHWLDRISPNPADWRVKDRAKLDPLTLYLQRMCAKNDSTGHAGPFTVGTFDPGSDGVRWAETPVRHRAFLSRWVAETILAWYRATHDAAGSAPRRAPGVAIVGRSVDHLVIDHTRRGDITRVVGKRTRFTDLSDPDVELLALCDGERTVEQIGRAVGVDAIPGVARLAGLGLVVRGPEIPYGVADPLPILRDLSATADSPELTELVAACESTLDTHTTGDRPGRARAARRLAELLERTTGPLPERGTGGFYHDRAVVYEESVGRLGSLVLGGELTERVRRALPLITDAFLFLPRLRHRLDHDVLADWFAARFPAGSASVNDYLRAFADEERRLAPAFDRVDRTVDDWHDRLRTAAAAVGSPADDLERFQKFLAEHGPRLPAVCDVDLMLASAPDRTGLAEPTRLVVGEVHADEELLTHGMFAPFVAAAHPTVADQVLAAYRALLGEDEILMNATVRHTNKTYLRQPLDCPDVEIGDRSPLPPGLRRHLADLLVTGGPDGLRLVERATGRTVRMVTTPLSWLRLPRNPMEVFGFPKRRTGTLFEVRPGETLREVAFDDLVLSRRAWSIDAARLRARDARDAFLAVRRLRDGIGLPRHVFARTDTEGKPIYVDLDSPLLVRQLTRFAARADQVRLSEMVPGPDELWLRTGGCAYTSELRFAAFDGRR